MPTGDPILIEAAIDSVADAERAVREGATRLEVCGNLGTGGLTPSADLLQGCLALAVPCVAMVRPRDGVYAVNVALPARARAIRLISPSGEVRIQ